MVSEEGYAEKLLSMSNEECIDWLRDGKESSRLAAEYADFIDKHGHRGLMELDIAGRTWDEHPIDLVRMLKGAFTKSLLISNKMNR